MPRILVIDDDSSLREVVRIALESEGFEVIEAADGQRGVKLACEQMPDLVLCDVRMHGMDGYGALAALRSNTVTATLPFILMTGQADQEGMRHGMEQGADDYLPKPFRVQQLLAAVEARLRKHATVREQAEKRLTELRTNISMSLPHELLTPLNGILGFADILASDASSLRAEDIGGMAVAIRESAERLHRVIQNFLLLAHVELQGGDPTELVKDLKRVSLKGLVERLSTGRAEKAGRRHDLRLELEDVDVQSREDYCIKIVEEIIDNAFKFSSPGSPVTIRLSSRNGMVTFYVSDRGRGMKSEHIAEVGAYMQFERRFYEQQGSGLGLTIARRLTEMHHGTLVITSELGVGTAVEIRLPAAKAS
jgi:signal transduction histidine kinase